MNFCRSALLTLSICALALAGCNTQRGADSAAPSKGGVGAIAAQLTLPDDSEITEVSFTMTGPNGYSRVGTIPVGNSTIIRFRVGGIPIHADPYMIALSAMTSFGEDCAGSAPFMITSDDVNSVVVQLLCGATDPEGDLLVDADITSCPLIKSVSATPAEILVGFSMVFETTLTHGSNPVAWSTSGGGSFHTQSADTYQVSYLCELAGVQNITVAVNTPDCNDAITFPVTCTLGAGCGNGVLDPGEQCDDNNTVNDDGCSNSCRLAVCGDGILQAGSGETCDDNNSVTEECAYGLMSCVVCNSSCQSVPGETDFCGDGTVDPGEDCDGDASCNPDCTAVGPVCGNGIVEGSEECDDGNTIDTDACANDCTANDPCDTCRVSLCDDYQGVDWVLGCFDATAAGDAARSVAGVTLTPAQVQTCVDAIACADPDPQNCLYDPIAPVTACYCGSGNTVDFCNNAANPATGDCRAQWEAMAGSTVRGDVMLAISDISLPTGWAYFLAECSRLRCAAECTN